MTSYNLGPNEESNLYLFYLFFYLVGDTGFGIQITFLENNLHLRGKSKKPLNLYQSCYEL